MIFEQEGLVSLLLFVYLEGSIGRGGEALSSIYPQAEPFYSAGTSGRAILFIHGFTASPSEMFPLAALLQKRLDCTVSGILLPGHGSHPDFLNRTTWEDWFNAVQDEIQYLHSSHDRVDVVGLSMGGMLAIYAGVHIPNPQSIITINAPIISRFRLIVLAHVLQWVFPHFPKPKRTRAYLQGKDRFAYKVYPLKALSSMLKLRGLVKAEIAQLTKPILIIQAQQDESVDPRSLDWLSQHITNAPQDVMRLERSEHIATMGPELELLADRVVAFLQAHE